LFAALSDHLKTHHDGEGVIAIVRMALTAGWVIGPVLGSFLAASVGYHSMLFVIAACNLAQIIPLGFLRDDALAVTRSPIEPLTVEEPPVAELAEDRAKPAGAPPTRRPGLRAMAPLLAFTGLYVLVYAGEPIKYGFLPIYMNDDLHLPAVVSGAVIGIQPLIELLLMPLSVIVGRRIGILPLMVVGAAFGVAANLCFALTSSAAGMFAGQILMGGVWGVFAALGIILAQRLLPQAVATASAIFMSSTAIASALGGLTGGIGVAVLGLPLVFVLPAAYGVIAVIGLAVMARRSRRSAEHRVDDRLGEPDVEAQPRTGAEAQPPTGAEA